MGEMYQVQDNILEQMKHQRATKERTIVMLDEFTRESCYKIQHQIENIVRLDKIKGIKDEDKVITILISSYGGCAFSCLSLIGVIERLKEDGYTIITHINSMAMSAGFFLAITGSKRVMNRYGVGLLHPMLSGTSGSIQKMIDDVEFDKVLWGQLVAITMKYTKFTMEDLEDLKRCKTDKYMLAEEMKEKGCIDEIL